MAITLPSSPTLGGSGHVTDHATIRTALSTLDAAKAASPTFTLLNAGGTLLTGATSVTVGSFSGLNWLFVRVDGASSASASSYFSLQLNADAGSNYMHTGLLVSNAVAQSERNGSSSIFVGRMGAAAADTVSMQMLITGTKSAGLMPFILGSSTSATGGDARSAVGHYAASAGLTSVKITSSVGNFDAGTIYVYGA